MWALEGHAWSRERLAIDQQEGWAFFVAGCQRCGLGYLRATSPYGPRAIDFMLSRLPDAVPA